MRASSLAVPFLRSAAAAAFASGCLVNGSQALAASAGSVASPQTGAAFSRPGGTVVRSNQRPAEQVMVSDSFANVVSVFDAEGHLQTRLKKGVDYPFGITTDAAGNLYVANTGASNVLVYAQPYKAVTRVLTLPNQSPADVAVSTAGVIAVMGST